METVDGDVEHDAAAGGSGCGGCDVIGQDEGIARPIESDRVSNYDQAVGSRSIVALYKEIRDE